mgnify:CR=1 FL=1
MLHNIIKVKVFLLGFSLFVPSIIAYFAFSHIFSIVVADDQLNFLRQKIYLT